MALPPFRSSLQPLSDKDTEDSLSLNILRPKQNGRHIPYDTFKCIFLNENVLIVIKISLKFDHKRPINNIPALVQIMAWRCPDDKPLSEPMMVSLQMLMHWSYIFLALTHQFDGLQKYHHKHNYFVLSHSRCHHWAGCCICSCEWAEPLLGLSMHEAEWSTLVQPQPSSPTFR